jgi:hypothetical protein
MIKLTERETAVLQALSACVARRILYREASVGELREELSGRSEGAFWAKLEFYQQERSIVGVCNSLQRKGLLRHDGQRPYWYLSAAGREWLGLPPS